MNNKFSLVMKIIMASLLTVLVIFSLKVDVIKDKSLISFKINNKKIVMKKGTSLEAEAWNYKSIIYNKKEYKKYPVIKGGVTIGSSADDVVKMFDIKKGEALVDKEVSAGDGETDVIVSRFKSIDEINKSKYVDLILIFGYKNVNGNLVKLNYKELKESMEKEKNILYYIGFNGLCGDTDQLVECSKVASISIYYN